MGGRKREEEGRDTKNEKRQWKAIVKMKGKEEKGKGKAWKGRKGKGRLLKLGKGKGKES